MTDLKIAVTGCAGRMGRALIRQIAATPGTALAGGVEAAGSPYLGEDLGTLAGLGAPLGLSVGDDALGLFAQADAVVDFTRPAASLEFTALAAQARIIHVIGTTGFDVQDEARLQAAARHATIIKSGNMSLGVNLLAALAARVAQALDEDWDIEILDMHHRHKVDAPSGTALLLGEAAAAGRGVVLGDVAARGRDGIMEPRVRGEIGFASLRGGSVVGEHRVIFAADQERIELNHIAEDRSIFARGAIKAALWGHGKGPGLFTMLDVLGIDDI